MRRGRTWRGGGGNFRGGGPGPGHNQRGFMSSGPPRLNRPPWPRPPPLMPHLRPSEPFYEDDRFNDHFEPRNFQNNPHNNNRRGFQRGGHHQFQRGRPDHRLDPNRPTFEPPSCNFSKPPPSPWENPPPLLQQGAHNQQRSHTKFDSDGGSESQRTKSEPNRGEEEGKQDNTNFNKALHSLRKVLDQESKDLEEDSQEYEQRPDSRSEERHHFQNDDFQNDDFQNDDFQNDDFQNDDFQNDDFHSDISNSVNFRRGPENFMRGRNFPFQRQPVEFHPRPQNPFKFDRRPQNNEVDFSKPPPFHPTTISQDYGSEGIEYNRQRERSLSVEVDRAIPSARTTLLSTPDYSGQRPPATDHYIDSSGGGDGSFHKSIGDTVDLIKKRLQDRQENPDHRRRSVDSDPKHWSESESPEKQKKSKRRHSHKDSHSRSYKSKTEKKCSKMKKKIYHELFKMDTKTLHKIVDDPQSNAKFEFALNSLITESRNSLNRQMRKAAEKSLSGSSSRLERLGKDDSVYEDTFMAQMQGVLEPHDIVMLSDIKPMVMAEINKVLQLDEYGQQTLSDEERYHSAKSHRDSYDSETKEHKYYDREIPDRPQKVKTEAPIYVKEESLEEGIYISDLEEEPPPKVHDRRYSHHRSHEPSFSNDDMRSKFPDNFDSISDDEYPFAELDKQYHVAVEYSMMDHTERSPTPQRPQTTDVFNNNQNIQSAIRKLTHSPPTLDVPGNKAKDIHEDILKIATNEKILSGILPTIKKDTQSGKGQESVKESTETVSLKDKSDKPGHIIVKKEIKTEIKEKTPAKAKTHIKSENIKVIEKESMHSVARKREADDKISHRKEKRKKCDSEKSETNKKVLNKNIIINVNDCASKSSEKCETRPKFLNVFIDQGNADELREDSKKSDSTVNISYSDKYVKRKQLPKINEKDKKTDKKKENNCPPTGKTEKIKLQPIDIFGQTPRKSNAHTALRNTSLASPENKTTEQNDHVVKTPAPIIVKRSNMKMIKPAKTLTTNGTQTVVKLSTRFTQTTNKTISTACQTDPSLDASKNMETAKPEDVMDRMKQIDLEIQNLLQEKFKLYKNLENATPAENMQSLGMAIVNINSESADESKMLDTFAQMSEEELQEIALQDLQDTSICLDAENANPPKTKKTSIKGRKKGVAYKDLAKVTKAKKKNVPKVVLKYCSESHDEYEVVKSPKKLKKVTFEDKQELCKDKKEFCKESRYKRASKPNLPSLGTVINIEDSDTSDSEFKTTSTPIKTYNKKRPKKQLTKKQLENLKRTVRPCSVILTRAVFSKHLVDQVAALSFEDYETKPIQNPEKTALQPAETDLQSEEITTESDINLIQEEEIAELTGIRLQDDMLDVSEDIVIDGNCDMDKSMEAAPNVDEDCSVVDNGTPQEVPSDAKAAEGCKLYDYSTNGEFGTEMVAVVGHGDAIVAIECVNNNFLAASIDGNVYHYNGRDGQLLATLRGSNFPLTCLNIKEEKYCTTVYTGSLDSRIRYYDLDTGMEKGPECNVLSPIQSMDRAWDTIFVGTRTGFVLQFECKNNLLIPVSTLKFSEQAILAIRAMKEGPRKVLLIASRSDQVTIKDAQTGLLLRTLEGPKMTVYSLLFEEGKVYCGTSNNHIQVFDFTGGTSIGSYTSGKGVVCLRAAGGLLLAGCYDGCVYIYRGGREPVAQLRGPTDMLLSLAVLNSKIIASYKDRSMFMWKIPVNLLEEMVL